MCFVDFVGEDGVVEVFVASFVYDEFLECVHMAVYYSKLVTSIKYSTLAYDSKKTSFINKKQKLQQKEVKKMKLFIDKLE